MGENSTDYGDSTNNNTDPPDRDESGTFVTKVTHEDLLAFIEERNGAFTAELATEFDVSSETIRRKCYTLTNQGEIRARQIESGKPIFWQPIRESEE